MSLAGWWRREREKAKERQAAAQRLREQNAIVERRNQIERHAWGRVLGLGRPLTRGEAQFTAIDAAPGSGSCGSKVVGWRARTRPADTAGARGQSPPNFSADGAAFVVSGG